MNLIYLGSMAKVNSARELDEILPRAGNIKEEKRAIPPSHDTTRAT